MECILVSDTGSGEKDQYIVVKTMEKLIKQLQMTHLRHWV